MAYKLLGYVVWKGAKSYGRHRLRGAGRKLAIGAGLGVLLAGGATIAGRQRRSSS